MSSDMSSPPPRPAAAENSSSQELTSLVNSLATQMGHLLVVVKQLSDDMAVVKASQNHDAAQASVSPPVAPVPQPVEQPSELRTPPASSVPPSPGFTRMVEPFGNFPQELHRRSSDMGLRRFDVSPVESGPSRVQYLVAKEPFTAKLEELSVSAIIAFTKAHREYCAKYPHGDRVRVRDCLSDEIVFELQLNFASRYPTDQLMLKVSDQDIFDHLRSLLRPTNAAEFLKFMCDNVKCPTPVCKDYEKDDFKAVAKAALQFIADAKEVFEYISVDYIGYMPAVAKGGRAGSLIDGFFEKNMFGTFAISLREQFPADYEYKDFVAYLEACERIIQKWNSDLKTASPAFQAMQTLQQSQLGPPPPKPSRPEADPSLHALTPLSKSSDPGQPKFQACFDMVFHDRSCSKEPGKCNFSHDAIHVAANRNYLYTLLCKRLNKKCDDGIPSLSYLQDPQPNRVLNHAMQRNIRPWNDKSPPPPTNLPVRSADVAGCQDRMEFLTAEVKKDQGWLSADRMGFLANLQPQEVRAIRKAYAKYPRYTNGKERVYDSNDEESSEEELD